MPPSTTTAPTTTEATNSNCKDITLDVCGNADQTTPFETVKLLEGQEEKVCQEICSDVFPVDRCTFFIYDRENELCELYDFNGDIYVDSCKRTAGTPEPTLTECKESNDPCTVRQQDWMDLMIFKGKAYSVNHATKLSPYLPQIWLAIYRDLYLISYPTT